MAKYPFTKKELRAAVRIFAEKQESVLEAVLDNDPVTFSDTFQHKMNTLLQQTSLAAAKRHKTRSRIAAAGLALILFLTAFFSFNTTARAKFIDWIKDIYHDYYIVYHFTEQKTTDALPDLKLEWVPEGYSLTDQQSFEGGCTYLYENNDRSAGFVLSCEYAHSGAGAYIGDHGRQQLSLSIAGYLVDCYLSDDDSDYIWLDTDGKFFFSINSNLPHDVNVKIIENLKIESK